MLTAQPGDYVLATKYNDGDPRDHWCVGFYRGYCGGPDRYQSPRHDVVDGAGRLFRGNGFRRVKKISPRRGQWLLERADLIESSGRSVWWWARQPMGQEP